jgi:hypothetical protein
MMTGHCFAQVSGKKATIDFFTQESRMPLTGKDFSDERI